MSDHYVQFTLSSGDYPNVKFECRANGNAPCRTFCQTCWNEAQDRCVCDSKGRDPDVTHGHPCNFLAWMEDAPHESYDGPDGAPVRGPEPQPVTFSWQGDYFTWEYAS